MGSQSCSEWRVKIPTIRNCDYSGQQDISRSTRGNGLGGAGIDVDMQWQFISSKVSLGFNP